MQEKGQTNAPQSPANAQSEHVQPHAVGGCGVFVWVSGAGVGSHSPGFDMIYIAWLYAVSGPQVHPLTCPALHEV